MAKRLELSYALAGVDIYEAGQNCVDILRPASGGYEVLFGHSKVVIPDHRVSHYTEDQRPGVAVEPEPEELPDYVLKLDGLKCWGCKPCKGQARFSSLHGLKTHWGMAHGGG